MSSKCVYLLSFCSLYDEGTNKVYLNTQFLSVASTGGEIPSNDLDCLTQSNSPVTMTNVAQPLTGQRVPVTDA